VYDRESAAHAAEVVHRAVLAERCVDHPLVLPADNGSPMKGETLLATLYRLGIATSYSRPRSSNDNPMAFKVHDPSHVWRAIGQRRHGVAGDYGYA
jgi:transposase InsO family protein